jgi:formimidoylglutamate deiminase
MTEREGARLARSGAVVGLCPTTEANLGDGIFPLADFLAGGGRFGIGSDSNVSTSPAEELRLLHYVARLVARSRNPTLIAAGASIGADLLMRAGQGGEQALGRPCGTIAPGMLADLVVLDTGHPALVGRSGAALLDAWVFAAGATPVRDVMVGGRWVVRDGRHMRQDAVAAAFARVMRRLAEAL